MSDQIIEKIMQAVGRPVSYKYPSNEGTKNGRLLDRAVISSGLNASGVPYWDVIDLIEMENDPDPEWIRIGYYRKPGNRLNWGSQTTITEPVAIWKRLLIKAATDKKWFYDLLDEVMTEVKKVKE